MTKIEWTRSDDGTDGETWNPTTGCDRASPGCDHCYALAMAKRLKGMGQEKYQRDGDPRTSGPGFGLTVHPDAVNLPLRWRKPRRVFVNSMSDLFHAGIPEPWLADIFAAMAAARRHTFQVLTKRHSRMRSLLNSPAFLDQVWERAVGKGMDPADWEWPLPNIWIGVSAESQKWADIRTPALLSTPAAVRFISAEPLLGPVDLGIGDPHRNHDSDEGWGHPHPRICMTCSEPEDEGEVEWFLRDDPGPHGIGWVIVGGESGPGARPMSIRWARTLVEECRSAGVPVFVKQLGSVLGRQFGAGPKGGNWDAWPEDLRIRQFPLATEAVKA